MGRSSGCVGYLPSLLGSGWVCIEKHHCPVDRYPSIWAHCCIRPRDGKCVVFFISESVVVWSVRVEHPCEWVDDAQRRKDKVMAFVVRKVTQAAAQEAAIPSALRLWAGEFPALFEYLSADKYPDGQQRERAMICLFIEGGAVKAVLQDRDNDRSLWVTGGAVTAVLESLETKAADPACEDWRAAKQYGKGKKK